MMQKSAFCNTTIFLKLCQKKTLKKLDLRVEFWDEFMLLKKNHLGKACILDVIFTLVGDFQLMFVSFEIHLEEEIKLLNIFIQKIYQYLD